jgi:hypothetical protein
MAHKPLESLFSYLSEMDEENKGRGERIEKLVDVKVIYRYSYDNHFSWKRKLRTREVK